MESSIGLDIAQGEIIAVAEWDGGKVMAELAAILKTPTWTHRSLPKSA